MKKTETVFFKNNKSSIFYMLEDQKAFSLIELMVTLVISVIISGMTVYTFLNLNTNSRKLVQKTDNSVSLSLLRKYLNKDLPTVGEFSMGVLSLQANLPSKGDNRNFFDYYKSYPISLLPLKQQTRELKFSSTDTANSYIYFLQTFTGATNGIFSINPFSLYDYGAGNELFSKPTTVASFSETKVKNEIPTNIRSSIWANNNLILFYVPLYFGPDNLESNKPVRLYSYLGVVGGSGVSFPDNDLLQKISPLPGDNTVINTLKKVIEHAPLVGGNKFQLYMTRVQWLTYFFQKSSSTTKGGKLYRCVNKKYITNFKSACNSTVGTLILDNIKNISFKRSVDSANIKVIVNLMKK